MGTHCSGQRGELKLLTWGLPVHHCVQAVPGDLSTLGRFHTVFRYHSRARIFFFRDADGNTMDYSGLFTAKRMTKTVVGHRWQHLPLLGERRWTTTSDMQSCGASYTGTTGRNVTMSIWCS